MPNGDFVSYLRVSTAKQGASGLGLEAQRVSVEAHLNGGDWKLINEFVEVESGKNKERPALAEALRICRQKKATLVIARLDRLARNVHFVSGLMESGVKFVACDMPEANKLTVHILAAVAEAEAEAISQRTKLALAEAKKRDRILGGRRVSTERFAKIRAEAQEMRSQKATGFALCILPLIREIESRGHKTYRAIAEELNRQRKAAPRGGEWSAMQVQRIVRRATAARP